MGCCWSCEDENLERVRTQNASRVVRPAPVFERPRPTESSLRISYDSYPPWVSENVVRNRILPVQNHRPTPSIRRVVVVQPPQIDEPNTGPLYGEFKCCCGYRWRSLASWRGRYQICKRCKTAVRPKNQREVLPTDYSRDKDDVGEHPQELCEQCIQLGRHCGKINK